MTRMTRPVRTLVLVGVLLGLGLGFAPRAGGVHLLGEPRRELDRTRTDVTSVHGLLV